MCRAPPKIIVSVFSYSQTAPHSACGNSSKLLCKCSYGFQPHGLCYSKLLLAVSLCTHSLSLYILKCSLPCDLTSLMGSRKVVDFQGIQPFSCWKSGDNGFHALTCQSGNLKYNNIFIKKFRVCSGK